MNEKFILQEDINSINNCNLEAHHLDTKNLDLNNKGNSHGVKVTVSYTNRPSQRAARKKLEELKNCK